MWENKTAIITGASRGIGKAIAVDFARKGASVGINYIEDESGRNASDAAEVLKEVIALGSNGILLSADITKRDQVNRAIDEFLSHFNKINILINNAGIIKDRTLLKMSDEEWDEVINVNLTGAYNVTKAVIPHLIKSEYGRIVNISSVSGQKGFFGQTNYSASKAGIMAFTRSLAIELAKYQITVNSIAPGIINTEMSATIPEDVMGKILENIPLKRLGYPEEVAKLVIFLCSEDASYITGQTISINGGLLMP